MHWEDGGSWWWMGFAMVLFWVLLLAVVVVVIRSFVASPQQGARSILDERYARGEIDDEEYRRRREALRNS